MAGNCRCPKCETLFKVPGQATGHVVQCPSCQASLTIAGKKRSRSNSTSHSEPRPPELRPVSSVTAPRRLKTTGNELPPELPSRPAASEHGIGISTGINQDRVDSVYPFRKKKQIWPTIIAMVMALVLVGGLFYSVAWIVDQQAVAETSSDLDEIQIDDPDLTTEKSGKRPSAIVGVATINANDEKATEPPVPRVPEKPEFFSQHDWDQAWQKINGYLVRLVITTPTGTREATGMIVDSRGWVITSHSAIENATTVSVTGAAKRLQDEPQWHELSDLSRGIVATAPQFDLAIIAINRSQVINLADPNMTSVDSVVPAQRLLIARTPPPGQASWISECRIGRRANLTDLDETYQKVIRRNRLTTGDPFRWIIGNLAGEIPIVEQVAGSPIVDLDGRVHAFATGLSLDGKMFAVPAGVVQDLLKSIGTSPSLEPFSGNVMAGRGSGPEPGSGFSEPVVPVDEFTQSVALVRNAIQKCRDTDWTADNAEEFAALQDLSRELFKMQELVNASANAEQRQSREETLQVIFREIAETLSPDLNLAEFDSGSSNQWFADSITPENPWCVLAVTVIKNSIATGAIDGLDATTLRLNGTNEVVVAKLGMDGREFQSGRKMLIFARVDVNRPAPHSDGESSGMVRLIEVHAGFRINL